MIKWLIVFALIGTPIIFLSVINFEENEVGTKAELGKVSIIKVGEEFVKNTSSGKPAEEYILGMFREITKEEIRKETELPDLKASETILNNGIRLSTNYNQISYDYSAEKITDKEYFSKLLDMRIKYEIYMTSVDAYIGEEDIMSLRNSIIQELKEINQQIIILKNYDDIEEGWELVPEYDKYKKFLPSMFKP